MWRVARDGGWDVVGRRVYGALRPGWGLLPSFLVIGAKRSGSTSLYRLIAAHPDVRPCLAAKGTHYFDVRNSAGWEWYRSQFPSRRGTGITGEASPYYLFHPLAATRIAAALPDVRLVAVLREPGARAHSSYHYEVRRGLEPLSFEAAIEGEAERLAGEEERMRSQSGYESFAHRHHGYLARGRYAEQLERFLEVFPSSQMLVLQSEEFFADQPATMARVFRFLDLRPVVPAEVAEYESASYPEVAEQTRAKLDAYFAAHNERLYKLPVVDFRWTCSLTDDRRAEAGLAADLTKVPEMKEPTL